MHTEPELIALLSSSRAQVLCYYITLPSGKMEYEETSQFFHCSPGRWTAQPIRVSLLCLLNPNSDRLHFIGNLSSLVYLLWNQFPEGRNASSLCESELPYPHTWHSSDAECSRAVLGSGGMRVPALHFWEAGMFGIVLLFWQKLPAFPAAPGSQHSTRQHARSPVLTQTGPFSRTVLISWSWCFLSLSN